MTKDVRLERQRKVQALYERAGTIGEQAAAAAALVRMGVAAAVVSSSLYRVGEAVFHLKFGNGSITGIDGNRLTINFAAVGEKRVVDSFVHRL